MNFDHITANTLDFKLGIATYESSSNWTHNGIVFIPNTSAIIVEYSPKKKKFVLQLEDDTIVDLNITEEEFNRMFLIEFSGTTRMDELSVLFIKH